MHFAIKHTRTKPYRPQTNVKIERFWSTFYEEAIEGVVYNDLEELKDSVLGIICTITNIGRINLWLVRNL